MSQHVILPYKAFHWLVDILEKQTFLIEHRNIELRLHITATKYLSQLTWHMRATIYLILWEVHRLGRCFGSVLVRVLWRWQVEDDNGRSTCQSKCAHYGKEVVQGKNRLSHEHHQGMHEDDSILPAPKHFILVYHIRMTAFWKISIQPHEHSKQPKLSNEATSYIFCTLKNNKYFLHKMYVIILCYTPSR